MRVTATVVALMCAVSASAEVTTPARPVTDPVAIVSPDGKTVYFNQDRGGDEQYDIYAVPIGGGPATNPTNTLDTREEGVPVSPDGANIVIT